MKLKSFQVFNFRSIPDSGPVRVEQMTALVGRNESGKSNLLVALQSLNPPEGRKPLSPVKDFPRDRRLEECGDKTKVVSTHWELVEREAAQIGELLGTENRIREVEIGRYYDGTLWVDLTGLRRPAVDAAKAKSALRRLEPIIAGRIGELAPEQQAAPTEALQAVAAFAEGFENALAWATGFLAAAKALRATLGAVGIMLGDASDELLGDLEARAAAVQGHDEAATKARSLVAKWLPTFVYVADFPELNGHQNIDTYLQRRDQSQPLTETEANFEKLAKVADFDPKELSRLRQADDHETRNQLLNRAGALVTREIRRLWKDRSLKVRFNIDGPHLDTLISDPNAAYDVEVNLDERSRGFRWFFSFYTTFAADTQGGASEGAILLLDEPGLYLHAKSQEDLVRHLRADFPNQIVYTTHSPFMIPPDDIGIVRTVNITADDGTTVTNDPTGDTRTLFPLQAALGYSLSQTLFVGHANLVVEGVTDFWILAAANAHMRAQGLAHLPPEMVITPAGGAGKVPYMAALMAAQDLGVLVLLDHDKAGRDTRKELVTSRLVQPNSVLLVSEAFGDDREADVEDLLDPAVYEALVRATYQKELRGKKLALNANIPRIARRFEAAFQEVGLEFNKVRPAREFMARLGTDPDKTLPAGSSGPLETLFKAIASRYEQLASARRAA